MQEPREAAPKEAERPRLVPRAVKAAKKALRKRGRYPQATEGERQAMEEKVRRLHLEPADWERPLAGSEPRAIPRLLDSMGVTPDQLHELTRYARDNLMRANETITRPMFEAVCVALAVVQLEAMGFTNALEVDDAVGATYAHKVVQSFAAGIAANLLCPPEGTDRWRDYRTQEAVLAGQRLRRSMRIYELTEMLTRLKPEELDFLKAMVGGVAPQSRSMPEFQEAVQRFEEAATGDDARRVMDAAKETRTLLSRVLESVERFGVPLPPNAFEPEEPAAT